MFLFRKYSIFKIFIAFIIFVILFFLIFIGYFDNYNDIQMFILHLLYSLTLTYICDYIIDIHKYISYLEKEALFSDE